MSESDFSEGKRIFAGVISSLKHTIYNSITILWP